MMPSVSKIDNNMLEKSIYQATQHHLLFSTTRSGDLKSYIFVEINPQIFM